MSEIKLFVDLDEVFCDFIGGAVELYGLDKESVETYQLVGEWSILPSLSRIFNREISQFSFQEKIRSVGPSFWSNLKPLPWFESLLSLINSLEVEWYILSSPFDNIECYTGKVRWIKDHFGHNFKNFLITEHKQLLSNKNSILIDDRPYNIVKFRS